MLVNVEQMILNSVDPDQTAPLVVVKDALLVAV